MKSSNAKSAPTEPTPVFPQTLHHVRTKSDETSPAPKSKKRDNIFSKSRDTHEDRGTRQMKTTRSSQSFSRGK